VSTNKILIVAIGLFLFSLTHRSAWAVDATLSWYPPLTDTDGTTLTNLAGYKIYYGTTSFTYTQIVNVGLTSNPAAPAYTLVNLSMGNTYYFAVTAYDNSGHESAFSSQVSKTFSTATTTTTTTSTTTTTIPNQPPSTGSLTPVNISTAPSVAQIFTAAFSNPNGWQNISDASLFLSGVTNNEWVHYSPATNKFNITGTSGNCSPGQATTISGGFLILNCGTSSAYGSGTMLTVTLNLTPQLTLSGSAYSLIISALNQSGGRNSKTAGTWIINRPPSANSVSPMNSITAVGIVKTFTAVYSDPDGWQDIAVANLNLAGVLHSDSLHYLVARNQFTMLGSNDVCSPGQVKTISNGYLTLDCGGSSISGSGTVLMVTYRVIPQPPSSGELYNIFTAVSDEAGAAFTTFAGTWGIQ